MRVYLRLLTGYYSGVTMLAIIWLAWSIIFGIKKDSRLPLPSVFFCVTSHYLSAASVVCPLPPAVHTSPPAFNARSSSLLCGWPVSLELVTWHCSWSETFIWQFLTRFKTFLFSAYCDYSTAEALRLCAIWIHDWNWHWHLFESYFRLRKRLGITRAVFYN